MKKQKHTHMDAPEQLSGDSLLAWHDFTAEAGELFTPADRGAMILLCEAWAEMREAARHIEKDGTIVLMPNQYPGSNPFCKIRNEARACVIKLFQELGLTVNARARIMKAMKVEEAEETAELEF